LRHDLVGWTDDVMRQAGEQGGLANVVY